MKKLNLTGKRFGLLIVVENKPSVCDISGNKRVIWKCKCDCGNIVIVRSMGLIKGYHNSCGCYRKSGIYNFTHGMSKNNRIYRIWQSMKQRCYLKSHISYKWYGNLGVKVFEKWLNSFESFYDWSMKNGYKEKLEIDRINPFENYTPLNCRWVIPKVNRINTRKRYGKIY